MQPHSTHFLTRPQKRLWSIQEVSNTHFSQAIPMLSQLDRTESTQCFIMASQFATLASNPRWRLYTGKQWHLSMLSTEEEQSLPREPLVLLLRNLHWEITRIKPRWHDSEKLQGERSEGGGGCLAGEKQTTSDPTASCQLDAKLLRV